MGEVCETPAGDIDPALIEESLALLAAFREIKSAQARSTLVWLAQSLAENDDNLDLVDKLSAKASLLSRRPDRRP